MATVNLSSYNIDQLPDASDMRIGIVVSEWNHRITNALLEGAIAVLKEASMPVESILIDFVPGSFELPFGAQTMLQAHDLDAVIVLGCVIRGETPHFDFVCDACAQGVMRVGLDQNLPVIFGVLTDENEQQSLARAGGDKGNKGVEAAVTALKMIAFQERQICRFID
jgi:6,7-dimethyl-8-ribityllumazine synthase